MARQFSTVLTKIKEVAPKELKDALDSRAKYWAPEIVWLNLTECVQKYVTPSSSDETSIAVYAILCDCTKEEIKARFIADNL